jgi:hypothetical protein
LFNGRRHVAALSSVVATVALRSALPTAMNDLLEESAEVFDNLANSTEAIDGEDKQKHVGQRWPRAG